MLVAIHQPHYLPWLRYFEKVARCEYFILLDDVDFTRNGWQNRNRIKTSQGAQILTVPVSPRLGMPICEVQVSNQTPWARKHWLALSQSYANSPGLPGHRDWLEAFYAARWSSLATLSREMFSWHLKALGLQVPWTTSSSLSVAGASTERLIELIRAVGGTAYLTGRHALHEYLDPRLFERAGVDLYIFDWSCPDYRQLHPKPGFLPDLATLDLLLCEGDERARELLRQGGRVERYAG